MAPSMPVDFFCGDNLDLFHFGRTLAGLYARPSATSPRNLRAKNGILRSLDQ